MDISELTLKLIIILLPGIIASICFEKITIHKNWTPFKFVYNSVLFGALSYISSNITFLLINFLTCSNFIFVKETLGQFEDFWENLSTKYIHFRIVIWASLHSVVIALIGSSLDHKKFFNNISKSLGISNKYGDESLYYYFLNSGDIEEVYIRDDKNGLTYHGLINAYSETDSCIEILLNDVIVYDTEFSKELYKSNFIYLAKNKTEISIEIPNNSNYGNERKTTETRETE